MSELLNGRWAETKEALLEGLQGTKKSVMSVTLENTRKYLSESATAGATSAGNVGQAPQKKQALVEAKEITGNKVSNSNRSSEDSNIIDIRKLAGLKI